MNVVVLSFVRVLPKFLACAALLLAKLPAGAEAPSGEVAFKKTKYPKIQVRHMPLPATDKVRQVPSQGTPRTELPVVKAVGRKGGKLLRVDNTYLVQCPAPAMRATNAVAAPKAD